MGSISIIICTRDRAASLRHTLASIGRCAVPADLAAELVVVDNGSTDDTAAAVREAGLANLPVRYVLEPAPGQVRARNAGLRATLASDLVLFTDDDVRVPRDWLAGMSGPILAGRADAVTGGVHFPPDYEPLFADEPFRSRRGWFAATHEVDPAQPGVLVGANMALGRRAIAAVGEFNPELGPGALGFFDDTVYAWRVRQAGLRLVAALGVSVEHHFDRARITPPAMLGLAQRMGTSAAHAVYHWGDVAAPRGPFKVWRAWALLWAERLRTLCTPGDGAAQERVIRRVETLAYWRELRRCRGTRRKGGAGFQSAPGPRHESFL